LDTGERDTKQFFKTVIQDFKFTLYRSNYTFDTLVASEGQGTLRWSNFDRRNPKMGVFLQSTEETHCGHHLK
jgi:hypothetical protein